MTQSRFPTHTFDFAPESLKENLATVKKNNGG